MDISTILIIVFVLIIIFVVIGLFLGKNQAPETWRLTSKTEFNKISQKKASPQKLMELDKLADYYLKNSKVRGETMGERLKNARKLFSAKEYNDLWEAHKHRNRIAHEVGLNINFNELKRDISNLSTILKNKL